jgi:hypothetical protein
VIVESLLNSDRRRATLAMAKHIRVGQRYWSRAIPCSDTLNTTHPARRTAKDVAPALDEENR